MTAGKWQDFQSAKKLQSYYSFLECDVTYSGVHTNILEALCCFHLQARKPDPRQYISTRLQGIMSQKTVITAVRT
jgi:hypothetical protein